MIRRKIPNKQTHNTVHLNTTISITIILLTCCLFIQKWIFIFYELQARLLCPEIIIPFRVWVVSCKALDVRHKLLGKNFVIPDLMNNFRNRTLAMPVHGTLRFIYITCHFHCLKLWHNLCADPFRLF